MVHCWGAGGNCRHVIILSPPTQKKGRRKNICAPVLYPCVYLTRSWPSPLSAWGGKPTATSLIPWGTHIKALHRRISGTLALSFHGLSLALLLSAKPDSLELIPGCLIWAWSFYFHCVLGNFSWCLFSTTAKGEDVLFSFLIFLSLSFPLPVLAVSSCTVLLPSTHKTLEPRRNGPFSSYFHPGIKHPDFTVFFLSSGLCYYPLCVPSGSVTVLLSRASQQNLLFSLKAPAHFTSYFFRCVTVMNEDCCCKIHGHFFTTVSN